MDRSLRSSRHGGGRRSPKAAAWSSRIAPRRALSSRGSPRTPRAARACGGSPPLATPSLHLVEVAPYLVRLENDAPFTRELLRMGWGESFFVLALSAGTLEELRRHFRRFLKVKDEAGATLIFRWYDPRVLRVYLPTCSASELHVLFGPVGMYMTEGETAAALHRFYRRDGSLEGDVVEV
jgi:hypothetical protein